MGGPPSAPRDGLVKVIFVDIPGGIAVDETFTPVTTYNNFITMICRISSGIQVEGRDISKTSQSGCCWWYRIVKNITEAEHGTECSQARIIKGSWQILNNFCAYDKLIGEVTLGVTSQGGWIEIQHDLQKKRDEAEARLAQTSWISPTQKPQDDAFSCVKIDNDFSGAGDDSSETSTTSQQVEEVQNFLLANAVCPGQTEEAEEASWVFRYKNYRSPLVVHGDLPSYTTRPAPFAAQIGEVPLFEHNLESTYENTQGDPYNNQDDYSAINTGKGNDSNPYHRSQDRVFPGNEDAAQYAFEGYLPTRNTYPELLYNRSYQGNIYFGNNVPLPEYNPGMQYENPNRARKWVPASSPEFNNVFFNVSPARSLPSRCSSAYKAQVFPLPPQDLAAANSSPSYLQQPRLGYNIERNTRQDNKGTSKANQLKESRNIPLNNQQFEPQYCSQPDRAPSRPPSRIQSGHLRVEDPQTASVHPSPTLRPARTNFPLPASSNYGTAAPTFADAHSFNELLNQPTMHTYPAPASENRQGKESVPHTRFQGSHQWKAHPDPALEKKHQKNFLSHSNSRPQQWNSHQPGAFQEQYSIRSSQPTMSNRSRYDERPKTKSKIYGPFLSKTPPMNGQFSVPKPRVAQIDAKRVLDRYASGNQTSNLIDPAAAARVQTHNSSTPWSDAPESGINNPEDGFVNTGTVQKKWRKRKGANDKNKSEGNSQTAAMDVAIKVEGQEEELTKKEVEQRPAGANRRSSVRIMDGHKKKIEGDIKINE